ncbi:MAG: hypothetical protein COU68_04925 [Candidatus Pacebacteria bacterium CG10_big_fil_rev_8_21_14_0_10_45_6]|nr:MAG: hypothetical protein COU68_04925 [Candidatus Pacebacteria bacterium CG10_big_fil_rev_8_21_14_0_10_45_6]
MKKKSRKKTAPPHEVLREKAALFMQDEQKLLAKYGIAKRIVVTFPQAKRLPLMGRFAIILLKWSRGVIDVEFGLINK